jgi:hypothetical protein
MQSTIGVILLRVPGARPMIWRSPDMSSTDIYGTQFSEEVFQDMSVLSPDSADVPPIPPSEFTRATVVNDPDPYAFRTDGDSQQVQRSLDGVTVTVKGFTAIADPCADDAVTLCAIVRGTGDDPPDSDMFMPFRFLSME